MGLHIRGFLELVRMYGLAERHQWVRNLCRLFERGLLSDDIAEAQIPALQPLILEQERRPNYLHRAPDDSDELYPDGPPDIRLGRLEENPAVPIGMHLSGAVHALIPGRSGAGKTTTLRRGILALDDYNRRYPDERVIAVCLDRQHNYDDIVQLLAGQCLHLDVHQTFRLGLNAPKDVPPNIWINYLATSFCARAGLRFAWVPFANQIRFLLTLLNPHPSDQLLWPDFQMLLDLISLTPATLFAPKSEYTRSEETCLQAIIQATGTTFRTHNGLDLERDVIQGGKGKHLILSMCNVSPPWLRQFIADVLIYQVLLSRMHRSHRVSRTEVIFVIDEADADVSAEAAAVFPDGMCPPSEIVRKGREFGLGVWLGLGEMLGVSSHILAAAAYHFFFSMGHSQSILEAKQTLRLPPRGEELLPALVPGECLVRLPGRWHHAMLGLIDPVPPNRTMRGTYDTHPYIPARPLAQMPEVLEAVNRKIEEDSARGMRQAKGKKKQISPITQRLLELAAEHPWKPVARLWELMSEPIPPAKRQAAVRELDKAELADFEDLRIETKSLRLIGILPKGWEHLGRQVPPPRGRGGLIHTTLCAWIEDALKEKGHHVETEWLAPRTSHHCDLAVKRADSQWDAIEVCATCIDNIPAHLRACLIESSSVQNVTIVAAEKKRLAQVRQLVEQEPSLVAYRDRIEYRPVKDYLKEE